MSGALRVYRRTSILALVAIFTLGFCLPSSAAIVTATDGSHTSSGSFSTTTGLTAGTDLTVNGNSTIGDGDDTITLDGTTVTVGDSGNSTTTSIRSSDTVNIGTSADTQTVNIDSADAINIGNADTWSTMQIGHQDSFGDITFDTEGTINFGRTGGADDDSNQLNIFTGNDGSGSDTINIGTDGNSDTMDVFTVTTFTNADFSIGDTDDAGVDTITIGFGTNTGGTAGADNADQVIIGAAASNVDTIFNGDSVTSNVTSLNLNSGDINIGDGAGDAIDVLGTFTTNDLGQVRLNSNDIEIGNLASDAINILGVLTTDTGTNIDFQNGEIQGTNALVFEGSTDDGNETTFVISDPQQANTITFPDASGTVALTSSQSGTMASNADYVVGADLSVADATVAADNVELDLLNGANFAASTKQATVVSILSVFPTAVLSISAGDSASTGSFRGYGGTNGQTTISTNCGAPTAVGATGLEVCIDQTQDPDQLVVSSTDLPGSITTHDLELAIRERDKG